MNECAHVELSKGEMAATSTSVEASVTSFHRNFGACSGDHTAVTTTSSSSSAVETSMESKLPEETAADTKIDAKKPEDQGLRIAMIGNVDSGALYKTSNFLLPLYVCYSISFILLAGKSTLVGCLTRGVSDDGRGTARQFVFRHRHEKQYGRTSSVGVEIMVS